MARLGPGFGCDKPTTLFALFYRQVFAQVSSNGPLAGVLKTLIRAGHGMAQHIISSIGTALHLDLTGQKPWRCRGSQTLSTLAIAYKYVSGIYCTRG